MSIVPVIDIAAARTGDPEARRAAASEIGVACEKVGFFMVTGHGVPQDLIDGIDQVSREFFYLPADEKNRIAIERGKATRGYRSSGLSTLGRGTDLPPDLRESFVTGPEPVPGNAYHAQEGARRFFAENRWPERPAALRGIYERYYAACSTLATDLMRLFALALELPEHFFDDKIDREISALNVNHYPRQTVPPLPGQVRAAAHTDYGSLTILATDGSVGGLQVLVDGEWESVVPASGAFIINLGDLMAQWTNDRWRSTLHRVINPPAEVASSVDRQSTVFFHEPNFDAVIECLPTCRDPGVPPKYPTISAGEHLMGEIAKTYARQAAN